MVMAVTGRRVTVMPLTTKGEDNPSASIAIPAEVAKAMGLRGEARWSLVPGELNAFEWTGHDLRQRDRSGSFVFWTVPAPVLPDRARCEPWRTPYLPRLTRSA
ncbi:hypothetical protein [Novosphingobium sp. 9U]|uniref:hypothetical protein n=1 Tax=Novosphingobium sp. 9U TaxID=2653158 RepID=UPI0012F2DC09|nr:hypothetical protein [Novosphingobium sp. 9U]VWX51062.1 hypothetical protein NOVOSPHI9U_370064 [Novosphingobium sp. 9U]